MHEGTHDHPSDRLLLAVFAALVALLFATVGISWVELGALNFPVAVAIASVKAALILLIFMNVRYSRPLIWLMAGAGFFWLGILLALSFSDYGTR
jgi:cytochrome c oxidase subunit 4